MGFHGRGFLTVQSFDMIRIKDSFIVEHKQEFLANLLIFFDPVIHYHTSAKNIRRFEVR